MSTAELIRHHVERMPVGQPFLSADLLSLAPRATVDKNLTRLVNAGELMRVARGVFVRPEISKHGKLPPPISKVVMVKAANAQIQVHGAEAVRRFGLSTQVPLQPVYYTAGPSKKLKIGSLMVRLKHISPRKIVAPGTNVGLAVSALWYLGKDQVNDTVIAQIKSKLTKAEYRKLKLQASSMPAWMSDAIHRYERQASYA